MLPFVTELLAVEYAKHRLSQQSEHAITEEQKIAILVSDYYTARERIAIISSQIAPPATAFGPFP